MVEGSGGGGEGGKPVHIAAGLLSNVSETGHDNRNETKPKKETIGKQIKSGHKGHKTKKRRKDKSKAGKSQDYLFPHLHKRHAASKAITNILCFHIITSLTFE